MVNIFLPVPSLMSLRIPLIRQQLISTSTRGDETQNKVQISPTVTIESSDTGKEVFENAFARLNVTQTGVAGGATASIKVTEQAAFDAFPQTAVQRHNCCK